MSLFSRIKQGLKKTKQTLGYRINKLFTGGVLTEEFYEELEDIMLSADIGSATTEEILDALKEVVGKKHIRTSDKVKDELKNLMMDILDENAPYEYEYPLIIMVIGVNGVGKTTAIGKLAKKFKTAGKSVTIAAADTFRAAASEQLSVWAKRSGARIIKHEQGADPGAVVYDAIASVKSRDTDVLLIDTAGRLHNKKNLMNELAKISRVIDREFPSAMRQNFIVLDATTGQNALNQADIFDEEVDADGIILTKLDGTAKGGMVLAINNQLQLPVVYIGVGEGVDDLEEFDSEEFVSGIMD